MSGNAHTMLSVGIDVGTTTTQLVFSQLVLQDTTRSGSIPRIQVTERSVLFQSDIRFTPLRNPDEIDAERLVAMVSQEYRNAGIKPEDIETGAVIVTGEIARTKNADVMLDALSELAGDFVVTVAGPNVEALIAGRGSGAAAYSAEHYTQITNIDIGGGTSNAAVFRAGKHISSSGLSTGGRLIQIEPTSGIIRAIAKPGRRIIEYLGLPIREGKQAEMEHLQKFCACMADMTIDLAFGREGELGRDLQLTSPLKEAESSSAVSFSGGVAWYYYNPVVISGLSDVIVYEDLGPLFAQELRLHPELREIQVIQPPETLRATVLGAAAQTVTLSGSTIWADRSALPLRNLAVVRPRIEQGDLDNPQTLDARFREAARRWDITRGQAGFALVLDLPKVLSWDTLQSIVEGLSRFAVPEILGDNPLVLVLEHDYAQVIGQTLTGKRPDVRIVSIDQVGLGEGDFIDLGTPILEGRVVPLSIKTLIFYS
jgi:ethanolamine utilization protein EutA